MYKFLIFDADHTLFDFDMAEESAVKSVLKDAGIEYNSSMLSLYKDINHRLWSDYELGLVNQNDIKFNRFRDFLSHISCKYDYKKAAEDYLVYLSHGTDLLPGAEKLIKKLGGKYILGLLTNGISKVQHPRLKASVLSDSFDAVAVSGDYGISKPDPKLFEILCEKAAFQKKDEILMIGDSLTSDMQGGYNFEIDTCWYNPGYKKNDIIDTTYEIHDLNEIYSILEGNRT